MILINVKLRWLKDGAPLQASNRFFTDYDQNTGVARLKIANAILADCGLYSVVAENKAGTDRTNGTLDVLNDSAIDTRPIVDPNSFAHLNNNINRPSPLGATAQVAPQSQSMQPARIVKPLVDQTVKEDAPHCRLVCQVEGSPTPKLVWLKNGQVLPSSNRITPSFDFATGLASLDIRAPTINDAAYYELLVENPAGSDQTGASLSVAQVASIETAPLAVKAPSATVLQQQPQHAIAALPPKVIKALEDTYFHDGQPVTLTTKILGKPAPKVNYRNKKKVLHYDTIISDFCLFVCFLQITWMLDNQPLRATNKHK